jgi:hypothetical protein
MPDRYVSEDLDPRLRPDRVLRVFSRVQTDLDRHVLTLRATAAELDAHWAGFAGTGRTDEMRELARELQALSDRIGTLERAIID